MSRPVTIALIQMRMSASPKHNVTKAVNMVRAAASQGAQVVCLPELYRTHYFPRKKNADVRMLAEPVPGESTAVFSKLARELGAVIIVPVFEDDGGTRY